MKPRLSRRQFLQSLAVISGAFGIFITRCTQSPSLKGIAQAINEKVFLPFIPLENSTNPEPTPTATGTAAPTDPAPTPSDTPEPQPTSTASPGTPGRVVHVHAEGVTSWDGTSYDYWNQLDQDTMNDMVDTGLMQLTGTNSIAAAWQVLLPNYQVGQGIAIKASFNNTNSCDENTGAIDSVIEPFNAIIRGLKQRGVAEDDIWIYDAFRALPLRFTTGCDYPGVRFYDNGCNLKSGWSSNDPYAVINFPAPEGAPAPPPHRITDVVINATYLINLPIMKKHDMAGVSLGFKNHYGTTEKPGRLHPYSSLLGDYFSADYSTFVEIYKNPHIGGKTILTIGDGLFASFHHTAPPYPWVTFGNTYPKSLFFSTDPVAIDCIMTDLLAIEFDQNPSLPELDPRSGYYLAVAASQGLGVHERGDPWADSYTQIDYQKVEI